MPKHQGQPSMHKDTTGWCQPSQSGATKFQTSKRFGKNPQSTAKSTHQGQTHTGMSGHHQGQPSSPGMSMGKKSSGGRSVGQTRGSSGGTKGRYPRS